MSLNVGFALAACSCPQHLRILLHNGNDCLQLSEFLDGEFLCRGLGSNRSIMEEKRDKSENQVTDFGEETRNYLPSTPLLFI